jgi:hypothetical protein
LNRSESVGVRNDAVVFCIRADHMFARLERHQRRVHRHGARRDDEAVDVLDDRPQRRGGTMARKRAKGKKIPQSASAKRRTGKAAKKPRKPAAATSPPKPAVPTMTESPRDIDLLSSWSPSRYSTR